MAREDRLIDALSAFARTMVGRSEVAEVLDDLVPRITEVLDVAGAAVSLSDGGRLRLVSASDPIAELARLDGEEEAGPAFEAFRSGEPALVARVEEIERRWPLAGGRCRAAGLSAMAGIPMRLAGESIGVVSLFDSSVRDWSAYDLRVACVLSDMATSYVVMSRELERQRRTAQQLEQALQSRVVIEQAKGVLAAERQITVDQAFELLRNHARRHNADLRSTAEAVVRLGLRP